MNDMKGSSPDTPSGQLHLLRLSDLACRDPELVGPKSATLARLFHILPVAIPAGVALSPPQAEFGSSPAALRACVDTRRNGFEFQAVAGVAVWPPGAAGPQEQDAVRLPAADDDIVGVMACGGRVRGDVRLVLADQDMLDMTPGEILVTASTTPGLMLAVEKAAGIVTDEGGTLCHAAIVSREFDIPCVIGTENATRRLRTGDVIDICADDGRFKIVSRAPPA